MLAGLLGLTWQLMFDYGNWHDTVHQQIAVTGTFCVKTLRKNSTTYWLTVTLEMLNRQCY